MFLFKIALCAHVIEMPEDSKIIVFNMGIFVGLNVLIPLGGHIIPISIAGASLLCRNVQKNDEKNRISEQINKIIPIFILVDTLLVCIPWNVASRIVSRHHWIIVIKIIVIPMNIKVGFIFWNQITAPVVVDISPIDPEIGQGLLSTKWNGWFFIKFLLNIKFLMLWIRKLE